MRNGESCDFDVSKIVAAISKACIRSETKKVEKKIHEVELFSGVGGFDELPDIKEDIEIFAKIVTNHHFKWWFNFGPHKGLNTARLKGGCCKHFYWLPL